MIIKNIWQIAESLLTEIDDDDPFTSHKKPVTTGTPRGTLPTGATVQAGSHNPPSGMSRIKPQMAPPRSTPKGSGPPKQRVDPATEFLRSQNALGGLKGPGSGIPPKSVQTSTGPKPKDPGMVTKPNYKGSYVGQSVNTGGTYQHKPVSWTDKNSQDPDAKRYGQVQSKVDTRAVWNGSDWVSPSEYQRNPSGKKENVWNTALRLCESQMNEVKFSSCGKDGAFQLFNSIECSSPQCKNYKDTKSNVSVGSKKNKMDRTSKRFNRRY